MTALRPLPALVAVLTLATLELVRCSGPLLDTTFVRGGAPAAALAAGLTYVAPAPLTALLLAGTRRVARPWTAALLGGAVLLALFRLVVQQLAGDARVVVGLLAVAVAVTVLTLAVAELSDGDGGGRAAAAAVLAGASGSVGLQLTLGTWDAPWRSTPAGWAVAVAVALAVVLLAVLARREPVAAPPRKTPGLWALGPVLSLGVLVLANPASAAAQSGLPLAVTGPLLGAGLLLAAVLAGRRPRQPAGPRRTVAVAAVALPVATAVALQVSGATAAGVALVLTALLSAQLTAALLLGRAWSSPGTDEPASSRPVRTSAATAAAAGVVGLTTIGPVLVFQLDYDVPLGVPNVLVLVLTAAALAVAGLGPAGGADRRPGPTARPRPDRAVLLGSAVLLLLGAVTAVAQARPDGPAADGRYTGRVLTWNLHYGVSPEGAVDLEAVARVIEAEDPDVVLLQEVSRGWVQGGGVDMASWLSQRLDRSFAFAPAADGRFGNVVLARGTLGDVRVQPLPYGAGPQRRSALTAVTRLGARPTTVTSIHLQHRAGNTPTRVAQLQAFLAPPRPGAQVVGGDLNATPGSAEVRLLTAAGYVSAVDAVGDPATLTDPSTGPTRRIDWVLGRGVAFADAEVLTGVQLSDHLPLVVAVRP
ncbi:Metal-dependent hydrolase, endonuclease/exonuclease/phosphatase family [Friedmanniella luteola]|uniref:Metal-dependent hydrolase, endonuclease/exonuclease/phosphatase family n=1 Tax=Friedmanniella luteola TaxID=546871 RepID=A0A1H1QCL1_9ACTN|nr:Metal-dependent hydrolase, endonuclease/exonuclease/phosphatase family [Friedmanniella luteola]